MTCKHSYDREVCNEATIFVKIHADDATEIESISFRKFKLSIYALKSIQMVLKKFHALNNLKLQYCLLTTNHIRLLQEILHEHEPIKCINLDGNTIDAESVALLLLSNQLQHISLRLCGIKDASAIIIAQHLKKPEQTLISLNLSSNSIGNEGIRAIADALKSNRTLLGLNVANNVMDAEALIDLLGVFKLCPLNDEDIYLRRQKMFDYYKRKNLMLLKLKGNEKKMESSKQRISENAKSKSADFSKKSRSSSLTNKKKLEDTAEALVNLDPHPFVKDSFPRDKQIFCKGNNYLAYLNLGYVLVDCAKLTKDFTKKDQVFILESSRNARQGRISKEHAINDNNYSENTLKTALDVINYQRADMLVNKGLNALIFEGRHAKNYTTLIEEINLLIKHKATSRVSSDNSKSSVKSFKKRNSSFLIN